MVRRITRLQRLYSFLTKTTLQRLCRIAEAELSRVAMPMLDRRRTRQLLIFLGNVVSGVVTIVAAFAVIASGYDEGPPAAGLIFVVAPFLGICGWLFALERRGRLSGPAERVVGDDVFGLIARRAVPSVSF